MYHACWSWMRPLYGWLFVTYALKYFDLFAPTVDAHGDGVDGDGVDGDGVDGDGVDGDSVANLTVFFVTNVTCSFSLLYFWVLSPLGRYCM